MSHARWPAAVAPSIARLLAADRQLVADLARGDGLLNRTAFGQELEADARALHTVAADVRQGLGLDPAGALDDNRFSLL